MTTPSSDAATRTMPMFPLGTVLLPGMVLPLYLFEPRYLAMYEDLTRSDRRFAVVLIERGPDSADDNPMFDIGCVAHILGSGLHEDGTISLVAVGEQRARVGRWLPSDPYPLAEIVPLSEPEPTGVGIGAIAEARGLLSELISLVGELDPSMEATVPELDEDPGVAGYQIAQIAGLQTLDLQRLLDSGSWDERGPLLVAMIRDQIELVELQLNVG